MIHNCSDIEHLRLIIAVDADAFSCDQIRVGCCRPHQRDWRWRRVGSDLLELYQVSRVDDLIALLGYFRH